MLKKVRVRQVSCHWIREGGEGKGGGLRYRWKGGRLNTKKGKGNCNRLNEVRKKGGDGGR